ncbi:hypothetical protein NMY22_g13247 [Coprinellus aureogranulatus]|nr:hypothetical protein NMY22_g13247 [Coprinellus aureogranulatus]
MAQLKKEKALEDARLQKEQDNADAELAELERRARQKALEKKQNPGSVYAEDAGGRKAERKRRTNDEDPPTDPTGKRKKLKVFYEYVTDEEDGDEAAPTSDSNPFKDNKGTGLSKDSHDALMRELDEDSGSGDDYKLADVDSESDEDGPELELDEDDTLLEKKKRGDGKKKEMRGVSVRQRIQKLRDENPDVLDTPTPRTTKKAKEVKPKPNRGHDGLRANSNKQQVLLPKPAHRIPARDESIEDDDRLRQRGGGPIGDDEDDQVERMGLMSSSCKVSANTKITDSEESSNYKKKPTKKGNSADPSPRAAVIRLPEQGRLAWPSVKSEAVNEVSGKPAWEDLPDESVCAIWNVHVDKKFHITVDPITPSSVMFDLSYVVLYVIIGFQLLTVSQLNNQVITTEWRHKFQDRAAELLDSEWKLLGLTLPEEKAERAALLLTGKSDKRPTDRDDPNKAFIWAAAWKKEFKAGQDPAKAGGGLLMAPLLLKVFAVHYEFLIGNGLQEEVWCKRPYGALILAVQAVQRALEFSLSGTLVIPNSKPGYFSYENWGDRPFHAADASGETVRKVTRRASVLLPTLKNLKDNKWEKIIKEARVFCRPKRGSGRSGHRIVSMPPEEQMPEDVILQDDSTDDEQ